MRVVLYVYLIVLSALLLSMLVTVHAGTCSNSSPKAEMKQLTLADVNQQQKQQPEKPAVRLVRQLGFGRRFGLGRFLPNPGFGNGGFNVGGLANGVVGELVNRAFGNREFGTGGTGGNGGVRNGGLDNAGLGNRGIGNGLLNRLGGGGGFGGRRHFLGRRHFANPGFLQQPFGFLG